MKGSKDTFNLIIRQQRRVTSDVRLPGSGPGPLRRQIWHICTRRFGSEAQRCQSAPLRDNEACLMGSLFHFPRADPLPLTF